MPPETLVPTTVISWGKFWTWIQSHPNCIMSAGTGDTVLYDDEDFHWHFATEEDGKPLVQVIRGKQMVGEIVVTPSQITYVQIEPRNDDEFAFECVAEQETDRVVVYHFTLSHGYDEKETATQGRWVH